MNFWGEEAATGAQGATGGTGPPGADGGDGATGPPGVDGTDGADGANGTNGADGTDSSGPSVERFERQETYDGQSGRSYLYTDDWIQIAWDGYDDLKLRVNNTVPASSFTDVYCHTLAYDSGTFNGGQNKLLSTSMSNYYRNSGTGFVEFLIECLDDTNIEPGVSQFPHYRVLLSLPSSTGSDDATLHVKQYTDPTTGFVAN